MKKLLAVSALAGVVLISPVAAMGSDSDYQSEVEGQELTGMGAGALAGGIVGGPAGLVVGAIGGALLGRSSGLGGGAWQGPDEGGAVGSGVECWGATASGVGYTATG